MADLHAALLDECRRLAEIAPAELAGAVAALLVVAERHETCRTERRHPCLECCHINSPCNEMRAIAAALGIDGQPDDEAADWDRDDYQRKVTEGSR